MIARTLGGVSKLVAMLVANIYDTHEGDRMPYENHTPNLDLLLEFMGRRAPKMTADALKELRYLKVQHANLLLDYYSEYNGVPQDAHNWSDDEILAWAAAEYERVSKL